MKYSTRFDPRVGGLDMKRGLSDICYGFFSALANPTRLAILERLSEGEMNVTGLASELGQEPSMVSHNLKILEKCSLVFSERRGKEKYVSLNEDTVYSVFGIVENHEKHCAAGNCPFRD
jgi:DNA-binding transcriptional ArsR family regulator